MYSNRLDASYVASDDADFNSPNRTTAMDLATVSGIEVFPCKPWPDKAPLTTHGFKDATTDPEQIAAWWTQWPDAIVGVPTGAASGIDALDVDPRHHGDKWLKDNCIRIPDTLTHRTRGGGQHLLLKSHTGLYCSASRIAEGVDVHANGGYIIWWPTGRPNSSMASLTGQSG